MAIELEYLLKNDRKSNCHRMIRIPKYTYIYMKGKTVPPNPTRKATHSMPILLIHIRSSYVLCHDIRADDDEGSPALR